MKKSIYIILTLFVIVFTVSCKKESVFETERDITKARGTLKQDTHPDQPEGNYVLVNSNGEIIFILFNEKGILFDDYLDKEVEIKGHKITNLGDKTFLVTKIK